MERVIQTSDVKPQASATAAAASASHSASGQPYMASSYSETSSLRLDQLGNKQQTPRFVYVLTFFSAIGGFLFGYDTGVISGAMILLRDEFVLDLVWQEMVVSVTIAAAAFFALIGNFLFI